MEQAETETDMPHSQTLSALREPARSFGRSTSENDIGIEEFAQLDSATLNRYQALQIRLHRSLAASIMVK